MGHAREALEPQSPEAAQRARKAGPPLPCLRQAVIFRRWRSSAMLREEETRRRANRKNFFRDLTAIRSTDKRPSGPQSICAPEGLAQPTKIAIYLGPSLSKKS